MYANQIRVLLIPVAALALWVALSLRHPARAQGPGSAIKIGRHSVSVSVDDAQGIALTTVRQELSNTSRGGSPASLALPIPDTAAVTGCELVDLSSRGKPPVSLPLAAVSHNLYQITVDNVPAGRHMEVQLAYSEMITRRGQRRKYVYPIATPAEGAASAGLDVEVRLTGLSPSTTAGSTTHRMTIRRPSPSSIVLAYSNAQPPEGRDVVVDWTSAGGPGTAVGQLAVLSPGSPNRDPYFLLTLPPPATLLRSRTVLTQPVDVVFCMDISASTHGRKLNALQEALHDGLVDLLPGDRFAVVAFDDDVRLFRRKLVASAPGAVDQAIRFVNRMRAAGGTDPGRALQAAGEVLERSGAASSRHRIVVLLTDEDDLNGLGGIVARQRRENVRVVVLGGKEDGRLVHHQLRGSKLAGGPAVALSRAAITFGPALGGVRFDSAELNASYIYPAPERLPDLPLSTPVVLVGRLSQAPPAQGKVYLEGTFEGKLQTVAIPYRWRALDPASSLPALWANRRIRRLQQLVKRDGDRDELLTAMESIRKEHGLQTVPLND